MKMQMLLKTEITLKSKYWNESESENAIQK